MYVCTFLCNEIKKTCETLKYGVYGVIDLNFVERERSDASLRALDDNEMLIQQDVFR